MYEQSTDHFQDEQKLATQIKRATRANRAAAFQEAYDFIHSRCLGERPDSLEANMFGTDDDVVDFLAETVGTDKQVLEIGCGCGRASIELALRGNRAVGIDVSRVVIDKARRFAQTVPGARFDVGSAAELGFSDRSFDFAFSIDVFEHIHPDDVRRHLDEVFRILRPGGSYLVITVNKYLGPHDVTRQALGVNDLGDTLPKGFHLAEYSFEDLYHLLKRSGFARVRSNALPWRRCPRNVFISAAPKAYAERMVRRFPKQHRAAYKILFRLFGLASIVCVAKK